MTGGAAAALIVAVLSAAIDWYAVATDRRRVEYVAKPLTMAALVGFAWLLNPDFEQRQSWFVLAAVLALVGDVFLMLPRDRFVAGLAAFLFAHVSYILGLFHLPLHASMAVVGVAVVAGMIAFVGVPVVRAVRARHPSLLGPVVVYLVVISTMVVAAVGTGPAAAAVGAVVFYASDGILAWNRFVRTLSHGRLAVMVTYHVGQALLLGSLIAG